MTVGESTSRTAEEFGERLFGAVLGTQLVQAAYLGDRLGHYRALGATGCPPGTPRCSPTC